ncbi:PQQ-binding-like beta-propeller repeat protein [Akkermansiaceae bacterium]|nr:PQQ-binding-like beta-propeller repeat protein [bacterium]MDA7907441.1 PQQ-binding-like beta-propeller repeat protein [Akkermansiaceae bacterium]MDA7933788.1 PQQ-binding-like beta-propeller repeat protein [Akkermansiaceae bacterium]MDA9829791.1 PQQ-binding-like beta-propeller repeat protein [Akkermansiaceae bacterium]MDB4464751.1 PQQ-binding-like beta-propeller repeat protein [Akkermansiaceae bacterium]
MTFRTLALGLLAATSIASADVSGWLNWRGPNQNGTSDETDLPDSWKPGSDSQLWKYDLNGAGAPVIADGKLFIFGYGQFGDDPAEDVQETLLCLDANTGKKIWEKRFSDYISDVVYNRYGVGSPVIDPETGNVYLQTSNGRCVAFTPDGDPIWEISLIEKLARLTFPNGRTGSPAVFENLVIFHCVTANWGTTGPAQDRFYAFDKLSGDLVWYSSPGVRPVDSSYSMPVFGTLGDQAVFYAGTGCGNVVCVNARTGDPVWRFQLSQGGVNSQILLYGQDKLIALHGKENIDATSKGRLVCLKIPTEYPSEQLVLDPKVEIWRNDDHIGFTSSPILVENRVYTTNFTGELIAVDADSGKTLWQDKQAPDQIHASPIYGDGKIYAPWFEGSFVITKPSDEKATVTSHADIKAGDGSGVKCLAQPTIWAGKVYLSTRDGLFCFGNQDGKFTAKESWPLKKANGPISQLQIVPAEFAIAPGQSQKFQVWGLNKSGRRLSLITDDLSWEKFIPPTAKVKAEVDATLDTSTGTVSAGADAKISAGALKVTYKGMSATTRGRIHAGSGYSEDFEAVPLKMESPAGEKVNFPPLAWLGARIKWYVLEKDGSKVIANRLDNVLFQRTMNFFGDPEMSDYVLSADVMTDGNRRIKSTAGLVNQRYLITLVGNQNILEVSSNHERVKSSVSFPIKANTWYSLKTHVKANADGSGEVRAKAWPKGEDEPAEWTIKVPVKRVHPKGSAGVFAFSPQAQKRVFLDNIKLNTAK